MEINKVFGWWGDLLGTSDDALSLLSYFTNRRKEPFILKDVLEDLHIYEPLKNHLLKSDDINLFYYVSPEDKIMHDIHINFNIGIDVLLNLAYIVAESQKSNGVALSALDNSESTLIINFEVDKNDLYLICEEFELFYDDPESYNIADLVSEANLNRLAEIAHDLIEQLI